MYCLVVIIFHENHKNTIDLLLSQLTRLYILFMFDAISYKDRNVIGDS